MLRLAAWVSDRTAAAIVAVLSLRAPTVLADLQRLGEDLAPLLTAADRVRQRRPDVAVPAPAWLTVDQAAAVLAVDPRTVRRWCRSGRLLARQGTARGTWDVAAVSVATSAAAVRRADI